MSGGGMGVGGGSTPVGAGGAGGAGGPTTGAYTPNAPRTATPAVTPQSQSDALYNSLNQPWTANDTVANLYRTALGREGEAAGLNYWTNEAMNKGWSSGDLARTFRTAAAQEALNSPTGSAAYLANNPDVAQAIANGTWKGTALEHYNMYGAKEGRKTGTGIDSVNPANFSTVALNRPSYYNTNPVGVDYANIFNPAARSVTSTQPVMTPAQQANYLDRWSQQYSNSIRGATDAANLERKNTANAQWEKYLTAKAQAEAATPDLINKAVEEKLAGMGYGQNSYSGDSNSGWYTGKAGGSVPGGLRSLKGKTKP